MPENHEEKTFTNQDVVQIVKLIVELTRQKLELDLGFDGFESAEFMQDTVNKFREIVDLKNMYAKGIKNLKEPIERILRK